MLIKIMIGCRINSPYTEKQSTDLRLNFGVLLISLIIIEEMENQKPKSKSSTGRWTKAQHKKFLEALEKYGRNWEKVQNKIKTRTLLQVRSHAQKFFLNISGADIDALIGYDKSKQESEKYQVSKKKTTKFIQQNQKKSLEKNNNKSFCQQKILNTGLAQSKLDSSNLNQKSTLDCGLELAKQNAVSRNLQIQQQKQQAEKGTAVENMYPVLSYFSYPIDAAGNQYLFNAWGVVAIFVSPSMTLNS